MIAAIVLVIAYGIDVLLGDPPNRWHPVAWMGQWIGIGRAKAPRQGNGRRFLWGMMFVLVSCLTIGIFAWLLQTSSVWVPVYVSVPLQAWFLKCSFSTRSLVRAAGAVQRPLALGDLGEARAQLSYHLVSRDTKELNESQISAAVIESVAENTSDSIVAPLFFYCIAGLPGAMIYRFVNTCDAMLGYRTPELEWLGKFPARLDDVLNWIPARITGAIMIVVTALSGGPWRRGLKIWRRDRMLTESPNAGQPMSVAAGVLGVELEKVDHYCLGRGLEQPRESNIRGATRLLWKTSLSAALLAAIFLFCSNIIGNVI